MLVLSRKKGEQIYVANGLIKVHVIEIRGDKVRIGIEADKDIDVHRKEVYDAIHRNEIRNAVPSGTIPPVHADREVGDASGDHRPDVIPIDHGGLPDVGESQVVDGI